MNDQTQALEPATTIGRLKHKIPIRVWLKCLGAGLALLANLPAMAVLPATGVTLVWNPSPSPAVTGYYVYFGGTSGTYTNKVFVGNTTTAILANLVAGSTYYFAATSCDAAGNESGYSNEAVYSIPATTTVPPLVALASPVLFGGNFSFAVPGAAGTNVAVEASVDLINWMPVLTNTPPFTFVDTNANQFTKRFYRTVTLP